MHQTMEYRHYIRTMYQVMTAAGVKHVRVFTHKEIPEGVTFSLKESPCWFDYYELEIVDNRPVELPVKVEDEIIDEHNPVTFVMFIWFLIAIAPYICLVVWLGTNRN